MLISFVYLLVDSLLDQIITENVHSFRKHRHHRVKVKNEWLVFFYLFILDLMLLNGETHGKITHNLLLALFWIGALTSVFRIVFFPLFFEVISL